MVEEKKLFTRKATGLVREIGFGTAVIIVMCNTIGLGWQKRVFQSGGWAPLPAKDYLMGIPPVVMAFFLAGIVIVLSLYCFAMLAAAMPKSGGGYVHITRILSPFWGYIAGWFEYFSIAVSFGMIAVAVFEAINIFGGLANFSIPLDAAGYFIAGLIIVAVFCGVACFGVKQTGRLLQVLFWIPATITVVVYLFFLISSPAAMSYGVKTVWGHTAEEYTRQAIASGIDKHVSPSYWSAVFTSIIAAYWAYIGYAASTFVAGEVKEANKTLPRSMFLAGFSIIFIYVTINLLLANAGGAIGKVGDWSLVQAVAYMRFGGGDWGNLPQIGAWMPMFAYMQAAGMGMGWFSWILVIFAAFWVANDIPPFILTSSRIIFAQAFDRVMPDWLASVNEKWHSPVNAVIFTGVIALFGCASESGVFSNGANWYIGHGVELIFGTGVAATDLWDGIFFTLLALAAFMFPVRKPDIFAKAPFKTTKSTVQIIAALAVIGNLWFDWVFLTDPHGFGMLGITNFDGAFPFLFTAALFIIFAAIYYYYRNKSKTTGVDYTTIYTEIPPD
jgi:APA family basic amino acid/polyamine antiporter